MPKKFDPTPYRSKVGKISNRFDPTPYRSKVSRFKEADPNIPYVQNALRALQLPTEFSDDAVYHHLGDIDLSTSEEVIGAMVYTYCATENRRVFDYAEYLDAFRRRSQIQNQIDSYHKHEQTEEIRYAEYQARLSDWEMKDAEKRGSPPHYFERPGPSMPNKLETSFVSLFRLSRHSPDLRGYLEYLQDEAPELWRRVHTPLPLHIEENPDRPHGYVLGTPGSGKSELLKLLVHTYVTNPKYGAVVIIDPTSDFAGQIAKWKEFNTSDRLIYVRPTLKRGAWPCINPFQIHGIPAQDYSEEALNTKRVVAQELVEALGRIVTESGGILTAPMRTILTNCVLVLLDKDGASLKDLSDFLKSTRNNDLIAFARTLTHHEYIADYFTTSEGGFNAKGNAVTRDAIGRRLDDLLSVGVFRNVTCGRSTIDLHAAVEQKKVLVFDLGKGAIGKREGAALGRLVIAQLISIAFRRETLPRDKRIPCSVVIDECHNFVSETMEDILTEARKYRLYLTMAQQIAGQRMPTHMKDVVLETTNLQVVGGTSFSGAKRNADIVGVDAEDVRRLSVGEFFIRSHRSGAAVKFRTRQDLLDWNNSVTAPTWKRMLEHQISSYYATTSEEKDETYEGEDWSIETD
ncbi:type IV secretory system conjugative DNA transfer family protein [Roseovarius aestuarii]|uniref:AAA-like domain protein n=1 Tax=Roseovarius aestuarii TaxID=475083 RepID=A0A1X7BQB5_9RHOB|nr:DUF87 domain-containing protein [Roseovarius aestuarii]SMC11822.1 AAA-like domain protein [Roseovarius aestuarii]